MVIKAEVTKDQGDKIRELASSAGMSISCVANSVLKTHTRSKYWN